MTKKRILAAAFIVVIALPIALINISAAMGWPINTSVIQGAVSPNEDNRSLREKAKQRGNFRETQNPKSAAVYADLADLANHSNVVIIGTAERNTPVLATDGKSISLDYGVRVEYAYKGRLQAGNTITVSLPGGRVKFDDGSTAEVMTPWFKKMQNGKTYALFLQPGLGNGRFVTTGEAQGVFEIPTTQDDRTVKSHSGIQSHSVRKYHGQDVKTFLRELRQVTGKPLKG
jgi:hypothetical protein